MWDEFLIAGSARPFSESSPVISYPVRSRDHAAVTSDHLCVNIQGLGISCPIDASIRMQHVFYIATKMTGPSPGTRGGEGSSSSGRQGHDDFEELDGDEAADLSLDNALLADDPLEDGNGKAP